jgi:spore maturation protein CgeB
MALRFLKISSYYRGFLNHYYQKHPEITSKSHDEQYEHLMEQYFAWSDNYGRLLAEKGLETLEVVANAEPLQRAWMREKGASDDISSENILLQQIQYFRPNVVYFQDSITYNGAFVEKVKLQFPEIQLCIGNLCAPFTSAQVNSFKVFDYFTVCSPFFKLQLSKYSIHSVIIPHAFDSRILNKIESDNAFPEVPFAFIGSVFADEGFHSTRRRVLEQMVDDGIPFSFYGNLPDRSSVGLLKRRASFVASRILDNVGLGRITDAIAPIRKGRNHEQMPRRLTLSKGLYTKARQPVFGLDMFKALSRAKIGFNIHIDCAGDYAANMRLFETTGVGTCLVTDYKSNISEFFDEGSEFVTYKSADDCIEKIRWLLDHPRACEEIARKGQLRTLQCHTFASRIDKFYDFMIEWLEK